MPKRRDAETRTADRQPTNGGSPHDGTMDPESPEAIALRAEMEERIERYRHLQSLPLPTPTLCPKARDDEAIVAEEVLDEYVVYDLFRHKVHTLNPTAATVWQWCDGQTPLEEMAERLGAELDLDSEKAEPVLYMAFDRLEKAKLLEERVERPAAFRGMRRRQMLGLVAASALPVVVSLVAPSASEAQSLPAGCAPCFGFPMCSCSAAGCTPGPDTVACCVFGTCLCATAFNCSNNGGTMCQVCA